MTALCGTICTDRPTDCIPCATDITPAQFALAYDMAEAIVHEMLGRRFGFCTDTIEVCTGNNCCNCTCDQCRRLKIVVSDRMPITSIDVATFTPHPTPQDPNPLTVPYVGLTVRNFNEITLPASATCFPAGVLSIQFTYGVPYPVGTCLAVRDLAAQFVASISCNCECALPGNVQAYARGDISYQFVTQDVINSLRLSGVPSLDAMIRAYGNRKRSTIYSPDLRDADCGRWYRVTAP